MKLENRYPITLDLNTGASGGRACYKQGSKKTSILEIHIVDSIKPSDISGLSVQINFRKLDKNIVMQDITNGVTISNELQGIIECVLEENTIAVPGIVEVEVVLTQGEEILPTQTFTITVSPGIGGGPLSTTYISQIETQMATWQTEFTTSETNRTNTFDAAETDRNSTFNAAETLRVTADTERTTEVNAIKDTYDAAVSLSAANATIELVVARKGEVDLPTKIGKLDSQLAQKAQQSDIIKKDYMNI